MTKPKLGTILCLLAFPVVLHAAEAPPGLCMGDRTTDAAVPHRNAAEVAPGVRLANGSLVHEHTDLTTAGRMMGLSMRRVYRSDMQFDGPIGQGWTGDLFQAAWRDEVSGDLLWHDADGFLHTFVTRDDAWRSPPGVYAQASYDASAVSLRRADGSLIQFNDCGQLSAISDRHGNGISLQYNSEHQLEFVFDDRGHSWEFLHDANGRITQLIDHVWETDTRPARSVEYEYDANARLVCVKLPETERYNDADGNRISWKYEYDSDGQLVRIFEPNQSGAGVARSEYEYESGVVVGFRDGDAAARHYLRYTVDSHDRPLVRHIDPRGVRADYTLDRFGRALKVEQYTGFWAVNHDAPIDHAYVVQAGAKLRSGDPNRFVTRYRFNRGHQLTRIDHPAGNCEEFSYPNPTGLARGHATSIQNSTITLDSAEWLPDEFAGGYVRLGGSFGAFSYFEVAGNTEDTLSVVAVDLNALGWGVGAKFVAFTENPDKLASGNLLEHRWISADAGQADIVESFTYEPYFQQVRSATSRRGFTTTYEYGFDTTGDPTDGDLVVTRSPTVTVLLPDGTTDDVTLATHYGYNAWGQLVSTVDPEGAVEARTYYDSGDQAGFLESIVRADGVLDLTEVFEYDKTGVLTGQYAPGAFESGATPGDFYTAWQVNSLGQRWHETGRVVKAGARVEVYRYYDANGNEARTWRSYVTADGDVPVAPTDVHDPDSFAKNSEPMAATWVETAREYDLANRLISEISDATAGIPVESVTWVHQYDEVGNLTAKISPLLSRTEWQHDERNLEFRRNEGAGSAVEGIYEFDYSLNGQPAAERTPLGNETLRSFDGHDRRVRIQDPAGNATEYEYDAAGNILTERCVDAAENLLASTDWAYDEQDRRNHQSRLAGDASGEAIGSGAEETSLTLDGRGSVVASTDGPGRTWLFTYDAVGRLVAQEDPSGNTVAVTLNAGGKPTRIDYSEPNTITGVAELSHWEADYNSLGLAVRVRDRRNRPDFDTQVSFDYDGWRQLVRVTDAAGVVVDYLYDLRSRPVSRREDTDALLSATGIDNSWDRDDRIRKRRVWTEPTGTTNLQETSFDYDVRNRLTRVTRPNASTSDYTYDGDSNVVATVDPTGALVEQQFEPRGLLVTRTITPAGGTQGHELEQYNYDGASRVVLAETSSGSELQTRTEWTWNTMGRAETRSLTLGDGNGGTLGPWTTTTACDVHGAAVKTGFSDGFEVASQRDSLSRLDGVAEVTTGNSIFALSWAGADRVIQQLNGNGTVTSYDYEAGFAGNVARLSSTRGSETLWGFDYRYDVRGLMTHERRDHDGSTGRVHRYDGTRRLEAAWLGAELSGAALELPTPTDYGMQRSYQYGMPGNRKEVLDEVAGGVVKAQAYEISTDGMNRYTSVGGFALTQDAASRVTRDASADAYYAYDFLGHHTITDNDSDLSSPSQRVQHDAEGRRVVEEQLDDGVLQTRTLILYSPDGSAPIEEIVLDASGTELHRVQYARHGDAILAERVDGVWRWRHLDAVGSLLGSTDAAGERTVLFDYQPFGTAQRVGVLADIAPDEITGTEADTPVVGVTRIHVSQALPAGLLGREIAIAVSSAAADRYRTSSVIGNAPNTLDVLDADGLIEEAFTTPGAGCLVLESRLTLGAATIAYDALNDVTVFTLAGAGFESLLIGGSFAPNVAKPGWFDIVDVDPAGNWLTLRGDATEAAVAEDHYRALPAVSDVFAERFLFRGLRHDCGIEGAQNRAGTYEVRGRSYDPRTGRFMTPAPDSRNPYQFEAWGTLSDVTPPTVVPGLRGTWTPSRACPAQVHELPGFRFDWPGRAGLFE